ncbi:MAG: peptide deformylase [Anaerolineaceae bacterium]|nr:peptide deformylase [Anaerolineaceae bacterium]
MAELDIVTVPNDILRKRTQKVVDFDKKFKQLVDDMVETMRAAPGVGLAAPQVGLSKKLIVVEYAEEKDEEEEEEAPKKLYVVANPEIIKKSAEMEVGIEACLSVPNLIGDVERHIQIVVKGQNKNGQPIRIKAKGWLARVFQHEIDHLNGVLYTDLAEHVWQPETEEELAQAA